MRIFQLTSHGTMKPQWVFVTTLDVDNLSYWVSAPTLWGRFGVI